MFHNNKVHIAYPNRLLQFVHKCKEVQLVAKKNGETITLVNGVALGKSIKYAVFAYLVFVRDKPTNSFTEFSNAENKNYSF